MHDIDQINTEFESYEYEYPEATESYEEMEDRGFYDEPEEPDEMELAHELLEVSDEYELEHFLGSVLKAVVPAAAKFARSSTGKALGGALKKVVKATAPTVGGALGSLIPVPGVGTAVGTALGKAVSSALELEFEDLDPEDQEFEAARRVVRIAKDATRHAVQAPRGADPAATAQKAVMAAVRRHVPRAANAIAAAVRPVKTFRGMGQSGRWYRRGPDIILEGARK